VNNVLLRFRKIFRIFSTNLIISELSLKGKLQISVFHEIHDEWKAWTGKHLNKCNYATTWLRGYITVAEKNFSTIS